MVKKMTDHDLYMYLKTLFLENGNISESEISKKIGLTQQNFNRKLKAGTLKFLEVQKILDSLGYKVFIEKDGKQKEMK